MPGGDRTGPMGMGPMTGRNAGYCDGYNMPGYANPLPGRRSHGFARAWGRGRGYGRGMGRGHGRQWANPYVHANAYSPKLSSQEEAKILRDQASAMQEEINAINDRIKELESSPTQGKNE